MNDFVNWMPEMVPVPPTDAGSVAIDMTGPVETGSMQRFTLTYRAGRYGIDDSGSLKICWRFASDMGKPQLTDPTAANFLAVTASNGAILDVRFDPKANTRPWDRTIHIKIVAGFMRDGDVITASFGTDTRGPGFQMQTFADPQFAFRVLVDPIATYTFVEVPGAPVIPIEPGPAHRWYAVLPTLRQVGDPITLCLRADDRWGNPTSKHGERAFALTVEGDLDGVPSRASMPRGDIPLRVEGMVARTPGAAAITATSEDGSISVHSNPVVVKPELVARSYWGDLHAQSGETIGSGTAEQYFRYARDFAFLDAVGHQGNDFQITPEFWARLNGLMGTWNKPGRFVTVPGYEWSGNTALGGDRNVFYETEDRPIRRSSHALVAARDDLKMDCWDARELFAALTPEHATTVVWAHCGGRYADIRYAHDAVLERSVEIHSSWGTFEWLAADAFDLGYRVGIVGNSDGHKGRPGAEPPGASLFGALGGLTCYLLPELNRTELFRAMRARHHYATTGCRLHLATSASWDGDGRAFRDDPRIEGSHGTSASRAIMGDIVQCSAGAVTFSVEIDAPAPILSVELRRGTQVLETIRPHADRPVGQRVRLEWSGAEYRGRARQTIWDGSVTALGGAIETATAINFFNPDRPLKRLSKDAVGWSSVTTGNFAGVDMLLSRETKALRVATPLANFDSELASLGPTPTVVDCGKLSRQVRLSRLPDALDVVSLRLERRIALEATDNPLWICVTLEDGHQAWSSPIYFVRD